MKYVKTFEAYIWEAAQNEVVFFPGRFMPFHVGHLAALKNASSLFGKPVIALQIISKNEESPFPPALLEKMGKDVVRANPFIADFFVYPQGRKTVIPLMVQFLREKGYEPVGVGAGADRMKDYERQIEYIKSPRTDTPVSPEFTLKMADSRVGDGPSGTKVRQALKDDDKATFMKLMPKELHKYYDELKKYIK